MTEQNSTELIKEELDHFMRLAHAQSKQLKQYADLQKRSHALIKTLLQRLSSKETDKE